MSDYGFYIWASYGVSAVVLGGLCFFSLTDYVRARRALNPTEAKV